MKGEFEFIADIAAAFPSPEGMKGIGDDCAVIPRGDGWDSLVSTDMLVEGTHFLLSDISPYELGWKAAAANFSDIAAMGGSPTGCFLALALPASTDDSWTSEFLRGLRDICARYRFPLLGGDTTRSSSGVCVCLTVLGKTPAGRGRLRSMARPSDLVCVTGTLGDSAAGLEVILGNHPREGDAAFLVGRHYRPEPRMEEGRILSSCDGVHAMMDISDGIGSDVCHIAKASGVRIEIDVQAVPVSGELRSFAARNNLDISRFAVEGGEDYELLFTVSPEAENTLSVPHTVIGRVLEGTGVVWKGADREMKGYRHF